MVWQMTTSRFGGGAWWWSERREAALRQRSCFIGGVREW